MSKSPMCNSQLIQMIKNNTSEVHYDSDKHNIQSITDKAFLTQD